MEIHYIVVLEMSQIHQENASCQFIKQGFGSYNLDVHCIICSRAHAKCGYFTLIVKAEVIIKCKALIRFEKALFIHALSMSVFDDE